MNPNNPTTNTANAAATTEAQRNVSIVCDAAAASIRRLTFQLQPGPLAVRRARAAASAPAKKKAGPTDIVDQLLFTRSIDLVPEPTHVHIDQICRSLKRIYSSRPPQQHGVESTAGQHVASCIQAAGIPVATDRCSAHRVLRNARSDRARARQTAASSRVFPAGRRSSASIRATSSTIANGLVR